MIIECTTCPVRQLRCDDCVVTVLHGLPLPVVDSRLDAEQLPLDAAERRAVDLFVGHGLVPIEYAAMLRARRDRLPSGATG